MNCNIKISFKKNNKNYFEIAIDNIVLMQVAQSRNDFCAVESCSIFRKGAQLGKVKEELATIDVLHYKAESILCLKRVGQMLHGSII